MLFYNISSIDSHGKGGGDPTRDWYSLEYRPTTAVRLCRPPLLGGGKPRGSNPPSMFLISLQKLSKSRPLEPSPSDDECNEWFSMMSAWWLLTKPRCAMDLMCRVGIADFNGFESCLGLEQVIIAVVRIAWLGCAAWMPCNTKKHILAVIPIEKGQYGRSVSVVLCGYIF